MVEGEAPAVAEKLVLAALPPVAGELAAAAALAAVEAAAEAVVRAQFAAGKKRY